MKFHYRRSYDIHVEKNSNESKSKDKNRKIELQSAIMLYVLYRHYGIGALITIYFILNKN